MLWSALIAFGHFLAFFALTAALVLQLTLVSESIGGYTARRIKRADRAYGLSPMLLRVFGFLSVVYF
jgi:putative membrane protein